MRVLDNKRVDPFAVEEKAWDDDFTKTCNVDFNVGPLFRLEIPGAGVLKTDISDSLRGWYLRAVPKKHHQKFGLL